MPALAAFGIFQFLWVWNDLLMAFVFIQDARPAPDDGPDQSDAVDLRRGVAPARAGAFLLMIVPLIVFFALQRYFVQGLLAGSVK